MSLKGLVFIGLFFACSIGALFAPWLGVYGYVAEYCLGPARTWWGAPFASMGFRFSFILVLATAVGMILQWRNLQFGAFLYGQEILLVMFLGCIWLSVFIGGETSGLYSYVDHPSVKMLKVFVFMLMMTHVLTSFRKIDNLFWVLVIVSLVIGVQAWIAPPWRFVSGRLEGFGGADFSEANFLAAFMASMLPIIGVQFIRSNLAGKIVCATAAAFTANTIVLCRSRGAILAILIGVVVSCVFSPHKYRKKIFILLVLGMLGGLYVTNDQFIERGLSITRSGEEQDESAQGRLRLWQAGAQSFVDHPFGIGAGNWFQTIAKYLPEYEGQTVLDSHNTYVKCFVELGLHSGVLLICIIFCSFRQLLRVRHVSDVLMPNSVKDEYRLLSFALIVSLTIVLMCGMTITMLYTELTWILLMLPVCLGRSLDNSLLDNS